MKPNPRKLRSIYKAHGGKGRCAARIVRCFPEHDTYCEPFCFGASVMLRKPKSRREILGDINPDVILGWNAIQQGTHELIATLNFIPYDHNSWIEWGDIDSPKWGAVSQAAQVIVRNRFSRGGLGKTSAWSDRLRGGKPGDANAWDTIRAELPAIAERVKDVEFHCRPALDLIREYDGPGTLTYADPPYLPETRTARKAYAHEMGREDHNELLLVLGDLRGPFFLSGYRSPLYDDFASDCGWHRIEWDAANNSGQGKTKNRRTEVLWSNRPFPGSVPCAAGEPAMIEG